MGVDAVRTSRFDKLASRASLDEERSDEAPQGSQRGRQPRCDQSSTAETREAIAFQSIQHWQYPDTPAATKPAG